jgi:hypothetical protein
LEKSFMLPAILGAETATAQHENQGMWSLQFRELPPLRSVIRQLVVRKHSPRNNVRSHRSSLG